MAVLETSFVTGLVVPSGVATAAATVLAGLGALGYAEVAGAAVAGGWVGDSTGYWIGRRFGRVSVSREGRMGAAAERASRAAARFLGRHPFYSVTTARLVPFVRTVMPLGAGSSGLAWPAFLAWEAPGLLAWAAMYMGAGYLAGQSWMVATSALGVGWTVVFVLAGLVLWLGQRRRRSAVAVGAPGAGGEAGAAGVAGEAWELGEAGGAGEAGAGDAAAERDDGP